MSPKARSGFGINDMPKQTSKVRRMNPFKRDAL